MGAAVLYNGKMLMRMHILHFKLIMPIMTRSKSVDGRPPAAAVAPLAAPPLDAAARAARGASQLMLANVAQRLVGAGLNQAMLRAAGPEALGAAAVELELLLSTLLFLGREPARLLAARGGGGAPALSRAVNMAWASAALVAAGAVAVCAPAMRARPGLAGYDAAVAAYCAAAVVEALGEPLVAVATASMR